MAIRNITVRGDEILTKKCKTVKSITPRFRELAQDMVDTMKAADGVGIAAPQVGVMKRFFVAMPHVDSDDAAMREKLYFMVNPEITYREGTQESIEGCLSVPDMMGLVNRPQKIRIKAMDLDGNMQEYEFEDFAATVFCHEYDHLDGILYPDVAEETMSAEEYAKRLEEVKSAHEDESEE